MESSTPSRPRLGRVEIPRNHFRKSSHLDTQRTSPNLLFFLSSHLQTKTNQLPRIWLMYLSIFSHPLCPPPLSHTHARHTYDRALRTLPPSLHFRIWVRYLLWAESKGGLTTVSVYRRYLSINPSITEHYTTILLRDDDDDGTTHHSSPPRPLEAAKLLLSLARKASRGEYTSPEAKSPYQLLGDFIDVAERFADEVGLDVDLTVQSNDQHSQAEAAEAAAAAAAAETTHRASLNGQLIRLAGPPVPVTVTSDGQSVRAYDEDEDPTSSRKLNVERIIHKDGLEVYKDQAGRLWTGLATYWIKRGEFDRAKSTFECATGSVVTVRDFTQIFDAYAEFSESLMGAMMESLENPDEGGGGEGGGGGGGVGGRWDG